MIKLKMNELITQRLIIHLFLLRSYICKREIRVRFKSCGHTGIVPCGNKIDACCPELCPFRLDCGHACERACHVRDDPDHLKVCVFEKSSTLILYVLVKYTFILN